MTAVEFLAEKYNYITWLRNRDEISAGIADEWRAKFLKEAKEMEKDVMCEFADDYQRNCFQRSAYQYYNETFNTKEK